ncbi:hypothetical protein [Lactobacillus taiwanensis]|uniref:hypothetical protein n=1 Tax=Lactobacillus taiwanensis TaxID=508451 RepID=UPI0032209211
MSFELNTVKLPTYFEKIEDEENKDSRFQKMKVYVAHTGVNLNNSIFSKEVLEKMLPSLSYIPILGYIDNNDDKEKDFRGHGEKISVSNGEVKIEYLTRAYGFVGEDHDAHFEITGGKEWLVCTGYLWTRFREAIDLFSKSNGYKGQSMEVVDGDGYVDGSGHIVFTDGKFNGLCILGNDVPPAMTGATISMEFSKTDVKNSIQEMLNEFSVFEKGAKPLTKKKKNADEEIVKDDIKSEDVEKNTTEDKTIKDESGEDKAESKESTAEKDTKPEEKSKDEKVKDEDEKESKDSHVEEHAASEEDEQSSETEENFSFDLEKRRDNVEKALVSKYGKDVWVWVNRIFDDKVIYTLDSEEKSYMCEYNVNADGSIKLNEPAEVFLEYLTAEEVKKVESERSRVTELEAELKELKKFQADVEQAEKEAVLKEAKHQLSEEKTIEIRAAFSKLSKEEVEKEIAYAIYQTNKGNNTKRNTVRAVNTAKNESFGFGTADTLFHK